MKKYFVLVFCAVLYSACTETSAQSSTPSKSGSTDSFDLAVEKNRAAQLAAAAHLKQNAKRERLPKMRVPKTVDARVLRVKAPLNPPKGGKP